LKNKELKERHFGGFIRPQGAPRGLLAYYILHRISQKPAHGYEILQDIESKTEGAWRPGAGSIYPILKKFSLEEYIRGQPDRKSLSTAQRVYEITPKGASYLKHATEKFDEIGKHWASMRRIFVEFMRPEHINRFLIEGTRMQFELWQEVFESKSKNLLQDDADYILKQYALMLERQIAWVESMLKLQKPKQAPIIQEHR
jgi:DNA-binding PadR family transcriptional regulator